jgi:hypothetical protein
MFRLPWVVFLFCLLPGLSWAKQDSLKTSKPCYREVVIFHDNDVMSVLNPSDRYYSFGSRFVYRQMLHPQKSFFQKTFGRIPGLQKLIAGIALVQEGYMPADNKTRNFVRMDRPYAGTLFLRPELNFTFPKNRFQAALDLGVIGSASGAGTFQVWIHDQLGLQDVNGWHWQVPNQFIWAFQFHNDFILHRMRWVEFFSQMHFRGGNAELSIGTELGFRLGLFDPLPESAYYGNRLSRTQPNRHWEVFVDLKGGLSYIQQDITYQGFTDPLLQAFFGDINHRLWHFTFGVTLSHQRFSIRYFTKRISSRSPRISLQDYGHISLFFRF